MVGWPLRLVVSIREIHAPDAGANDLVEALPSNQGHIDIEFAVEPVEDPAIPKTDLNLASVDILAVPVGMVERVGIQVLTDVAHFAQVGQHPIEFLDCLVDVSGNGRNLQSDLRRSPKAVQGDDEKLEIGPPAKDECIIFRLAAAEPPVL